MINGRGLQTSTNDDVNAKFSTNWDETDYSV